MAWTKPNFRNAPTAYLQANAQLQKNPIYYVKFGLVTGTQGTNSQVLPTQFATAQILNPTTTRARIMSNPQAFSSQVNPVTFAGTLGQITFNLSDTDPAAPGVVTAMVASYIMKNRYVVIYRGFSFLPESQYTPIYAGFISNWALSDDGTYYTFTVMDILKMATGTILGGSTTLIQDWAIPPVIADNSQTGSTQVNGINSQQIADGSCLWEFVEPYVAASQWTPNTHHYIGDEVSNNGNTYVCTQAGTTASSGNGPGGVSQNSCTWTYIGNQQAPPWQTNTKYNQGQIVSNLGCTFQCVSSGISSASGIGPTLPATMTVLSTFGFAPATDMLNGLGPRNYIQVGNCLFSYTGITNGNSVGDGTVVWTVTGAKASPTTVTDKAATWKLIGSSTLFDPSTGPWAQNIGYTVGNVVSANGYLWYCSTAGTSANTGTGPAYTAGMIPTWWPNTAYTVGAQVSNNSILFICQQAGTSASVGPTSTGIAGGQTFTGVVPVVLNNNGESPAQSQQAGSTVVNYVYFSGNPIDLILQILMSTGTGTNSQAGYTNYDVLPGSQGIGIPAALFNLANIIKLRSMYAGNMNFTGYFSAAIQGLKFIQTNILQQAMVFLYTNINGLIDINFPYPASSLDAITLDATNVVGNPRFDAHLVTGGYFYNQFNVNYDYQPLAQYYLTQNTYYAAGSIQRYQEISPITVNAQMLTTGGNGLAAANRIYAMGTKLFGDPPPTITTRTFDAMHLLNPGAIVTWSHPNTPNYKTGKRGGSIIGLVISAGPDFFSGAMNVTLLGIGYYLPNKYARWTGQSSLNSGSWPTWPSSSTQQKTYGYWGSSVGQNANGLNQKQFCYQSDSSPGTYWGP